MRTRPHRPPRIRGLLLNRLLPNILTVLALCAGLSAIRFAIQERWEAAVIAIVIAAVLDALDGRLARLLKVSSEFGAQLDSLSDFVSFGVAPATVLYLWVMQSADRFGWMAVLTFSVCAALRLARFNTSLGSAEKPPWAFNYFTGVPMPGAAGLVLLPPMLSFQLDDAVTFHPVVVALWTIAVAMLMVSRLPTFSFKGTRVPYPYIIPVLVGVGLLAASLVSQPWLTLTLIGSAYLVSIPFSVSRYRFLERTAAQMKAEQPAGGKPALAPPEALSAPLAPSEETTDNAER